MSNTFNGVCLWSLFGVIPEHEQGRSWTGRGHTIGKARTGGDGVGCHWTWVFQKDMGSIL